MGKKRSVTVRLGGFAVDALAGKVGNGNDPAPADVLRAIQFYLSQSRRRNPGWAYPAFMRKQRPAEQVEFELGIDDSLWAWLEKEAARQGVTMSQLLEHATLYYAAEMDSGWSAKRSRSGQKGLL